MSSLPTPLWVVTGEDLLGVARLTLSAVPEAWTQVALGQSAIEAVSLHRPMRPETAFPPRAACRPPTANK